MEAPKFESEISVGGATLVHAFVGCGEEAPTCDPEQCVLRPITLGGKHAMVKTAGTGITAVLEWARIGEFRTEGSPVEVVRRSLPKWAAS